MAIPQGWAHQTKTYLVQLLNDWITARCSAGTVYEGGGDLSGTFDDPKLYVLERAGYPRFGADNLLQVGYRLRFKLTEVQLDEALEQMTSTVDDLGDYLHGAVAYGYPTVGGARPPWIAAEIAAPEYPRMYDVKKGYLCNEVNVDVAFRLPVTRRGWEFPQRF